MRIYKWRAPLVKALRMARNRSDIIGVDYGFAYRKGRCLKTKGIRFHVANKEPLTELPENRILPKKIDNYRCDVLEVKYSLHGNPKGICDPLQPGISIGNLKSQTSGTLGLIVRDSETKVNGILSNWHVLCGSSATASSCSRAGDEIVQPGPGFTVNDNPKIIGTLERCANLNLGCDAAFVILFETSQTASNLYDSPISPIGVSDARIGMRLVKYGAFSDFTHGMVDGIGGAYKIDYSGYGDEIRWIDGIRIVPDPDNIEAEISLSGDSGAAWIDSKSQKVIGLHFAGEDGLAATAEYALAQPIERVFKFLRIELP